MEGQRPSVDQLRIRDEILQVMYWMTSQGLGDRFRASDITRFVACSEVDLEAQLAKLVTLGLLEPCEGLCWRLGERGVAEARHRFADELADLVGTLGHSHGETCGPDCADDHDHEP